VSLIKFIPPKGLVTCQSALWQSPTHTCGEGSNRAPIGRSLRLVPYSPRSILSPHTFLRGLCKNPHRLSMYGEPAWAYIKVQAPPTPCPKNVSLIKCKLGIHSCKYVGGGDNTLPESGFKVGKTLPPNWRLCLTITYFWSRTVCTLLQV
jgi:hypothetical protein